MPPQIDPFWGGQELRIEASVCQFETAAYRIYRNRRLLLSYERRSRLAAQGRDLVVSSW